MNTKLIMLIGACPGAGKSTLSAYLAEQLELNGLSARWFYEEAVLYEPTLTDLVEKAKEDKAIFANAVLDAARAFTRQVLDSNQIFVTDSLFPGFQWLIEKGCSLEELKIFSAKIQSIFAPLNSILIYLDCNVQLALERAFRHRGEAYQQDLFENMRREDSRKNLALTLQTVIEYWQTNNRLNLRLLRDWNGQKLILNTTELSQTVAESLLLQQLDLQAHERLEVDQLDPQIFVGQYLKSETGSGAPTQINIQLEAEHLRANLYWPAGCKLIARSKNRFQLENIAQYVDFELDPDGLVTGLRYDEGHHLHHYKKKRSDE